MMSSVSSNENLTSPVRHVVHFKFKNDVAQDRIEKVVLAFEDLKKKIPAVLSLEHGTNISPEGFSKGFTHCWLLTFPDEVARDQYLAHPDHKAFVELVLPTIEDVLVVDFIPSIAAS